MSDHNPDMIRIAQKWSQGDQLAFVAIHAAMVELETVQAAARVSGLTPRQKDALDFIRAFIAEHDYPPTFDEIRKGIDMGSKSGVARVIRALSERGAITVLTNRSRSIALP